MGISARTFKMLEREYGADESTLNRVLGKVTQNTNYSPTELRKVRLAVYYGLAYEFPAVLDSGREPVRQGNEIIKRAADVLAGYEERAGFQADREKIERDLFSYVASNQTACQGNFVETQSGLYAGYPDYWRTDVDKKRRRSKTRRTAIGLAKTAGLLALVNGAVFKTIDVLHPSPFSSFDALVNSVDPSMMDSYQRDLLSLHADLAPAYVAASLFVLGWAAFRAFKTKPRKLTGDQFPKKGFLRSVMSSLLVNRPETSETIRMDYVRKLHKEELGRRSSL